MSRWTRTRAYQLGLVSRLVEPGDIAAEALRLADEIAAAAPLAVRASRRIVLAGETTDDAALRLMSDDLLGEVLDSDDAREGLTAFVEKRPPEWRGR